MKQKNIQNRFSTKPQTTVKMDMKLKHVAVALTTTLTLGYSVQAQIASDNAGNYTSWGSTAGTATQTSGGTGFIGWTFSNTAGGNGSQNGSFLGGGSGIDSSGKVWALYANSGQQANAVVSLAAGLAANQTLSLQMQNGGINTGGTVGFSLRNSSSQNVFEFYFIGGGSDYQINRWSNGGATPNQYSSTVAYTTSPLTLGFTLGTGNSWSLSINGTTTLDSSSYGGALWNGIDQVRLFNSNAGNNNNVYFNNIQVVPEPSTLAIAGLSGLAALMVIRRRRV